MALICVRLKCCCFKGKIWLNKDDSSPASEKEVFTGRIGKEREGEREREREGEREREICSVLLIGLIMTCLQNRAVGLPVCYIYLLS